jgi:hypothetical protein
MCRIAQLKCKDSLDVAQLFVEGRGGRGDWLRLGVGSRLLSSQKVREEFTLAPVSFSASEFSSTFSFAAPII